MYTLPLWQLNPLACHIVDIGKLSLVDTAITAHSSPRSVPWIQEAICSDVASVPPRFFGAELCCHLVKLDLFFVYLFLALTLKK